MGKLLQGRKKAGGGGFTKLQGSEARMSRDLRFIVRFSCSTRVPFPDGPGHVLLLWKDTPECVSLTAPAGNLFGKVIYENSRCTALPV